MPIVVPGYNTENKVSTVSNNDSAINAEITTQAADEWLVSSLTLSGSNIIILFTRTIPIVA